MKRLACFMLVILMMIPFTAFAEYDLASMTADELVALQNQIMAELFARGELKEVRVPAGKYVVGEHIPEGEYSVVLAEGGFMAAVMLNQYEGIYSVTDDSSIGRLVLAKGDIVEISGTVVFTKFAGLGF